MSRVLHLTAERQLDLSELLSWFGEFYGYKVGSQYWITNNHIVLRASVLSDETLAVTTWLHQVLGDAWQCNSEGVAIALQAVPNFAHVLNALKGYAEQQTNEGLTCLDVAVDDQKIYIDSMSRAIFIGDHYCKFAEVWELELIEAPDVFLPIGLQCKGIVVGLVMPQVTPNPYMQVQKLSEALTLMRTVKPSGLKDIDEANLRYFQGQRHGNMEAIK